MICKIFKGFKFGEKIGKLGLLQSTSLKFSVSWILHCEVSKSKFLCWRSFFFFFFWVYMYVKLPFRDLNYNYCPHISQELIFVKWLSYHICAMAFFFFFILLFLFNKWHIKKALRIPKLGTIRYKNSWPWIHDTVGIS